MGKSFRFDPTDDFDDQEEVHVRKERMKDRKKARKEKQSSAIDWMTSDEDNQ